MLSTELDTPLPLLLVLVDTLMPPTATPRPGGCATPGLSRTPVRPPTLFACLSPSATPSLTRFQGLPVLRSLLLLRPLWPTLLLLLLPPLLWPLLVTEPATVPVLVPSVATLLVSLVLVLSATVLATVLAITK